MKALRYVAVLTVLSLVTGCGMEGPVPGDKPAAETAKPQAAEPPAAGTNPTQAAADTKPLAVAKNSATVTETAHVGMGEKGRGYGHDMITLPVRVLWDVKERLALMQIDHDMDLYNGSEGHFPKTQEEFMEKIIKENHIQLPVLPAGQTYVYDPEDHLLKIRKPADPDGP